MSPTSSQTHAPTEMGGDQAAIGLPSPPRRTTWTLRQNIARVIWGTLGRLAWCAVPPARSGLIRLFGGRVGSGCRFARSVEIIIPWNLDIGSDVQIGPKALLYGLGLITIGDRTVLDYRAHLCAGTHDMHDSRFPLLTPPITIGEECFIGLDAYIGPGVTLGKGCRVWPRASVYKDAPDGAELRGNPARAVDQVEAGSGP